MFLPRMTFSLSSESNCTTRCDLREYSHSFVRNKQASLKHIHTESQSSLILLSILVLLLTNLKGLAALQRSLSLRLAFLALQTEHQLLSLLRLHITHQSRKDLLVEDRLGLTTETLLLRIVSSLSYIHNLPLQQNQP